MQPIRAVAWWLVNRWVRRSFPTVPTVTTQELADWLSAGKTPVLLDVRRDYEFAVSHLPGAHPTPHSDAVTALNLDPSQPMVAYCSVGYRSARLASQLQLAGYSEVYNLVGSAFQWANEGRSLVSEDRPTATVHPFNPVWGLLLKPGLAKPEENFSDDQSA